MPGPSLGNNGTKLDNGGDAPVQRLVEAFARGVPFDSQNSPPDIGWSSIEGSPAEIAGNLALAESVFVESGL